MQHAEPILVQHEHDHALHWRRFVAVLCLMEFHVTFVYAGLAIWDDDPGLRFDPLAIVLEAPWIRIPLLVGAAMLYLCGRGLWRGGRSERVWLWLVIVSLFSMVVCEVAARAGTSSRFRLAFAPLLGQEILMGLRFASVHWLLLTVLAFAVWLTRPSNRLSRKTTAPWVYCAATYCLVSILCGFFGFDSTARVIEQVIDSLIGGYVFPTPVAGLVSALPLLAIGGALLCRWRFARTIALIVAAVNIVGVWDNWYPPSMLVRFGIRDLMLTLPAAAEIDQGMIWTKHDVLFLFVNPVRSVGPWLLIAIYAWKVPMRKPPDDGTPFPRRFCGHCYYNLRGIDANRCPECGTGFEHPVG